MVVCSYPDVNVSVGTAIKFVWPEQHGVYRIPSGNCPPQYAPGIGFEEVGPILAGGGSATTKTLAAGTYWYACQVSLDCPLPPDRCPTERRNLECE